MNKPEILRLKEQGEFLEDDLDFEKSPSEMWAEIQHE